jgi:uncharacterized protein (TIGR00266 family)
MTAVRKIFLSEGATLTVEPSAMLACQNVEMRTQLNGTIWAVAKRYFLGGESLFQNLYSAKKGGGWIAFEESLPGQINGCELHPGNALIMGRSAFVAADQNVKVSYHYAGVKGYFRGSGIAKLKAAVMDQNKGRVFFSSSAGIARSIEIKEENGPVIIDNDTIIAYTDSLKPTLQKLGNVKTMLFSGEGLVNEFKGNGVVYVGSGTRSTKTNLSDRIIYAIVTTLAPDPAEMANRVTLVALVYFMASSTHLPGFLSAARDLFFQILK